MVRLIPGAEVRVVRRQPNPRLSLERRPVDGDPERLPPGQFDHSLNPHTTILEHRSSFRFQVLTEREEQNSVAIASNETFGRWTKALTSWVASLPPSGGQVRPAVALSSQPSTRWK
jgi:hypothetical protein